MPVKVNLNAKEDRIVLGVRLFALVMLVVAMTMHLRSVKVFRWEQSFSGGVLVTYCIAVLGLALCSFGYSGGAALQVYLCGTGAILLAFNAFVLWLRWKNANDLTRVVAELLESLGLPLRRHVLIKVSLSAAAAIALLIDLAMAPMLRSS